MKRTCLAILVASTALVPSAVLAQTSSETAPAQQQATTQTQQQNQARPVTAASLSNQPIYVQGGKEFGRVSGFVRGDDQQVFAVVTATDNRQVLMPVQLIAFENNRLLFQGSGGQFSEYKQGSGNYQPIGNDQQIAIAGAEGEQTGQAGAQIVVQQPAPSVQVQQGAPQVSVQQPDPQVTVRQANPEILVRQPAPTVTVDIPSPEIIVRMPQPDVNVAMAQPQVEVRQPEPQVQIVQPESQSAVQVEPAQPQVNVQQGEAQVSLQQQGQPQVRYESAKPKVVINQPQEPKISYEQMQGGEAQQAGATDQQGAAQQMQAQAPQQPEASTQQAQTGTSAQQQAAAPQEQALATGEQPRTRTPEQRQAYLQRFGGDVTAKITDAQAAIAVSDLKNMNVWNSQGERLGEVDEVVMINNKPHIVIAHGGFLGIGEDKVAFPLDRFVRSGDNILVIQGVTEQDIEAMDEWHTKVDIENAKLADSEQLKLPELQSQ